MTEFKIQAEIRETTAKEAKRAGKIAGVVYGNNFGNSSISIEKVALNKLFKAAGTSNLVELSIDGAKGINTLIHDLQRDVLTGEIIHVDFLQVNMKNKIHAEIPLSFVGESVLIVEKEGTLITPKDSIEVECLPGDLISELEVDISVLDDFEKDLRVSDLKVPAGIEILDDADEVIAHVEEPRSDEELAELDTEVVEDVTAIEVENKGEDAPAEEEAEKK